MLKALVQIFINRNNFFSITFLILLFCSTVKVFSQSSTNLEQFYFLIDSLTNQIITELPENGNEIQLVENLGDQYSVFSNRIKTAFIQGGKEISYLPTSELLSQLAVPFVNIVIETAKVEYVEMIRDGWFGAHYVKRNCSLKGNYFHSYKSDGEEDFNMHFTDTVKVEDIKNLENESFPFTKGSIPPEPFLSGFAEPLIAIGIAASVVILFFTQRSK